MAKVEFMKLAQFLVKSRYPYFRLCDAVIFRGMAALHPVLAPAWTIWRFTLLRRFLFYSFTGHGQIFETATA
jgi:hypothetical protein